MIPIQKFGIDCPSSPSIVIEPSTAVPRLRAATTPSGMATTMAIAKANTASSIVAGKAPSTMSSAGWRYESEVPKSPRARSATKLRYCTCSGRSKPSAWRTSTISSGVARSLTNR